MRSRSSLFTTIHHTTTTPWIDCWMTRYAGSNPPAWHLRDARGQYSRLGVKRFARLFRLLLATPQRCRFWTGGAYGPDLGELARRIASDVNQILNGTKRGDIPLYHPNKFQLIINLKTATRLGSLSHPRYSLVPGSNREIYYYKYLDFRSTVD